jgi:6-phosphogluconolactonase (cycloisomerase 2 family)
MNGDKVYGYLVNPTTGAITPTGQGSAATAQAPARVVSDKGGYRLYVTNLNSKNLDVYFIYRNNGYLHPVPGSPFTIGQTPTGVAVHPSGKFVYVTAENNWVYAFAVQANGSLTDVAGSPFTTQDDPKGLAIDPKGRFLYVTDLNSDKLNAYKINNTTGALTVVPGSPYTPPGQTNPCCPSGGAGTDIAVDANSRYVILPGWSSGAVSVFHINQTTGALRNVAGSPFAIASANGSPGTTPFSVAVDPLDRFAYFYYQTADIIPNGYIATFAFNPTTGALSKQVNDTDNQCGDIARADPSGKFLYAIGDVNGGGCPGQVPSAIRGYSVNQSDGALTDVPGSPFATQSSNAWQQDGLAVTP